jgi:hypothetical protein
MSLLGNNVYANPNTPLWGGGGGSGSNPTFNIVTFEPSGSPPYSSTGIGTVLGVDVGSTVSILGADQTELGPLQGTAFYAGVEANYPRVIYQSDGIDFQDPEGTSYFLAHVNSGSNGWDLQNISTINGSPPSGGSYPRDASFNSILIDPTGVYPLSLGLGTTSNIMGIRRDEEGKEADYILFDPVDTAMDLSNVATINGAPYVPTITDTITANAAAAQVPLAPSRLSLSSNTFTPIADGKLTVTAFANFDSVVSTVANGNLSFEIDGTPGASVAWFGASAVGQRASATVCEVFSVTGGTPVGINTVASIANVGSGATGDFEAYESRTLVQFTAL